MPDIDEIQRGVEAMLSALRAKGWASYKASELRDPTEQWTVRTGYSGGEAFIQVNRFDQARFDQHVSSVDPYARVGYLRLHSRMVLDPRTAIQRLLDESGVPQ